MRLRSYFFGMLAGVAFAACSSDNAPEIIQDDSTGSGEQQYMAIRVAAPDAGPLSRATGDFVEGETDERSVKNVRIYLFNADGSAYTLESTTPEANKNFVDHTFSSQTTGTGNVSDRTEGVIVFQGKQNIKPAKMVALINLTSDQKNNLGTGAKSLTDIAAVAEDYSGHDSSNGFVMSTSVYKNNSDIVNTTAIASANIQPTSELAKDNPVKIYVERVLAKVTMKPNTDNNWTYDATANTGTVSTPSDNDYVEVGDAPIQAVVKGCGLANTIDKTYLLKSLTGVSTDPYTGWNDASNFRSSWAAIPTNEVAYTNSSSWKSMVPESQEMITSNYCMENTSETVRTQLVVAAQLQDGNGNPVCVFRFMGTYYMGAGENAAKNAILTASNLAGKYYTDSEGKNPLAISDLELKTASQLQPTTASETTAKLKSYQVVAQLTNKVATIYQKKSSGEGYEEVTDGVNTVNTDLMSYPAEVAKDGMVYYYTDIKHYDDASDTNDKYAVIRNHLYNVKITKITGFGTPIFDPEQQITPEKPGETESYIAAEINVLSWKTVDQDVELN